MIGLHGFNPVCKYSLLGRGFVKPVYGKACVNKKANYPSGMNVNAINLMRV
jgi:hypothetical protein